MPSFTKGNSTWAPFGKNQFLRSTQDVKVESYTISAASVPLETVNGVANQKILQPGEALAKITSGPEIGKVGPFQLLATDGRQLVANLVGISKVWLPWQLLEHDFEVGVVYQATCVQAWCFERDGSTGARIPLTNTTADALRGGKRLQINFV